MIVSKDCMARYYIAPPDNSVGQADWCAAGTNVKGAVSPQCLSCVARRIAELFRDCVRVQKLPDGCSDKGHHTLLGPLIVGLIIN